MTWAEFCRQVNSIPCGDSGKTVLMAVYVLSNGRPDQPIDHSKDGALASATRKKSSTLAQILQSLQMGGWVTKKGIENEKGRWVTVYHTARHITG